MLDWLMKHTVLKWDITRSRTVHTGVHQSGGGCELAHVGKVAYLSCSEASNGELNIRCEAVDHNLRDT